MVGRIRIEADSNSLFLVHAITINNHEFKLMLPHDDPFVILHLRESFREWILCALTLPIHERVANFQAYLEDRKWFYANAIILARSHLPEIPDYVGEMISNFIPRIQQWFCWELVLAFFRFVLRYINLQMRTWLTCFFSFCATLYKSANEDMTPSLLGPSWLYRIFRHCIEYLKLFSGVIYLNNEVYDFNHH